MPGSIQIYELCCPDCMRRLDGVSSDKLFICDACGNVYCATGGQLKKEALYIAAAPHPKALKEYEPMNDRLYLPFWRFLVDVHVWDAKRNEITRVSGAERLQSVWVPAFFEVRPNFFGNPGMNLTVSRVSPEPTLWPAEKQILLPGGARRVEEAALYVKPFVSGTLDRENDISGYDIDVAVGSAEYWALPFDLLPADRSAEMTAAEMTLKDLLSGATYPASMVERIDEIMAFRKKSQQSDETANDRWEDSS